MKEDLEKFLEIAHTTTTTKTYLRQIEKFKLRVENHETASYKDILSYMKDYNINGVGLSALKRYYDYLLQTDQRESHPCRGLTLNIKKQDIQVQDLFSTEELEILIKRECRYKDLKLRNKVIIGLLIYQGLSVENIRKLRHSDIDFDSGTVYIRATKQLNRRTLELKAKQIPVIYTYYQTLDMKRAYLFYNKLGEKLTTDVILHIVKPLQHLYVDRKLTATRIRQSVIRNWVNGTRYSLEEVQLLSGHKWLSTTERYKSGGSVGKREKINRYFPI